MLFCSSCGKEVQEGAAFCASCGRPLGVVQNPTIFTPPQQPYPGPAYAYVKRKDEGIAAVLSFFFTGLGQIYNGQIGKGIGFLLLGFVLALTIFILIGIILYPVFWIYNIYDAYTTAKKINMGQVQV